jgi:hypothetical protein
MDEPNVPRSDLSERRQTMTNWTDRGGESWIDAEIYGALTGGEAALANCA